MVYKVVWTPEALQTYLQIISYLEQEWTEREIKNFASGVEDKIGLLKKLPGIGSPFDKKRKLRKTLVHKQVQLYYRVRPQKRQVELVSFWNTYQNPNKLRRLR
jgi:plasmid stabilization system protein ParE